MDEVKKGKGENERVNKWMLNVGSGQHAKSQKDQQNHKDYQLKSTEKNADK